MSEKLKMIFGKIDNSLKKAYTKAADTLFYFKNEILDDPSCFESTLERP